MTKITEERARELCPSNVPIAYWVRAMRAFNAEQEDAVQFVDVLRWAERVLAENERHPPEVRFIAQTILALHEPGPNAHRDHEALIAGILGLAELQADVTRGCCGPPSWVDTDILSSSYRIKPEPKPQKWARMEQGVDGSIVVVTTVDPAQYDHKDLNWIGGWQEVE